MAGELESVVRTQPRIVRQDLLLQLLLRVLAAGERFLVAHCVTSFVILHDHFPRRGVRPDGNHAMRRRWSD